MWLSMLTADAAAQHGHEFSAPRPVNQNVGLRLPFPRNPLGAFTASMQRGSTEPALVPRRTLMPKRSRSLRVTMAELKEVPEEIEEWDEEQIRHFSIPGAYKESSSQLRLDTMGKADAMQSASTTLVPNSPTASASRSGSEAPLTDAPLARRLHRAKTHYRLAHPPPPAKTKKHLRPRVLLQLQQQTGSGFHRPSYEVVPACRFTSNTKVGAKLTKLRNIAQRDGQLNSEDLVVVQVDESRTFEQNNEDADNLDSRMAIGIICAASSEDGKIPGNAFIYLENAVWKATLGKAGIYDLVLQGNEDQRARWFVPKAKRQRPASLTGLETLNTIEDKKFYFTTIQPDTTKHPTVAAMTRQNLDVYSSYTRSVANPDIMDAVAPDEKSSADAAASFTGEATTSVSMEEDQVLVDEALRKLVIVSGAWLFFREGWSPFFHYSLTSSAHTTTPQSAVSLRSLPRSATTPIETLKSIESKSTDRRDSKTSTFQAIPRLVRSATSRSRSHRGRSESVTSPIPFSGFSESSSSRFASLKRGRSVVSPAPSDYSSLTVTAATSERSISPAPVEYTTPNLEEALFNYKSATVRPATPEAQMRRSPALRSSTPVPDSPEGAVTEPNTPVQYWKQYDALLSRNMHIHQDATPPSASQVAAPTAAHGEDISPSRRASTAVPLRLVTPRPTIVSETVFTDDIVEQHAPGNRHSRFHLWAHNLYSRKDPVDTETQPAPTPMLQPAVLPTPIVVQQHPDEPLRSPTLNRMQTMRASISSRMGRRSRRNTFDGPPPPTGGPIVVPATPVVLAAEPGLEPLPAATTTTTRIITTIKTTTRPSTAEEGAGAAMPQPQVNTRPPTAAPEPPAVRRRRLSNTWHRVKGLFGTERQSKPFAIDGTVDSAEPPRFDPGFHPRWLRAHQR